MKIYKKIAYILTLIIALNLVSKEQKNLLKKLDLLISMKFNKSYNRLIKLKGVQNRE